MKSRLAKSEKYSALRRKFLADTDLPDTFFLPEKGNEDFCIFYISCLGKDRFLYLDPYFHEFSGYQNDQLMKGGMDFGFNLL
jgi:hypothetical protein